ncbi:division/cell wall cluster transcriptional repressor MraZ [Pseudooceanicola sp. C21-150M6]|uniref:division/cell wall cluster transcriptional repressor MraZ n=1 Tax=Pseudooceanicola sp. C21-150M6 TaxID=3434355 RepID=UPI003D7FBD0C
MAYIERFQGSEDFKVDSKYRLSVPVEFRRVLESQDPEWNSDKFARMVLIYSPRLENYVEGYSIETISEIREALTRKPKTDKGAEKARRHFIHNALTVTVDDTGRIVVPAKVRDKLGLGKEDYVTFLGDLKTFQLWKKDVYDAVMGEDEDDDFDPDAFMDDLLYGGADAGGAE